MKIEIVPSLVFSPDRPPDPAGVAKIFGDLGVTKIDWLIDFTTEEFIKAFDDHDVEIQTLVTGWRPYHEVMLGANDLEVRAGAMRWFCEAIDLAKAIGAEYLAGPFGQFKERPPDAFPCFLQNMKQLVEYAGGKVKLLVEKMGDPSYPGFTWTECEEISRALKQPTNIIRDIGHMKNNKGRESNHLFWAGRLPEETEQYWHIYEDYHRPPRSIDIGAIEKEARKNGISRLILAVELFYTSGPVLLKKIKADLASSL